MSRETKFHKDETGKIINYDTAEDVPILCGLRPACKWTPPGRRQDYDGNIITVDTRYWPTFWFIKEPHNPEAYCSIILRHRQKDDISNKEDYDYTVIAEKHFESKTEEEVKTNVEAWVQIKFDEILTLLQGISKN